MCACCMPRGCSDGRSSGPTSVRRSFLSDSHGRDHEKVAELALDAEGRFLAIRLTGTGNMGAYLGTVAPLPPTINAVKNMVSVYRTPLIEVATQCVFTNTS